MSVRYSVLLLDPLFRQIGRLPVVSVDAGLVANDVARATVEVVPRTGFYMDDVNAFVVTRFNGGNVNQIGTYLVQTMTEKVDSRKRTWSAQGASPLVLYQQRYSANISTASTTAGASTIRAFMDMAVRYQDSPATIDPTRVDPASPNATTQTGVLETFSTIRDLARAAETCYGMDLRIKVNYDVVAVPTSGGLVLRPVVWTGEYGMDRRVGRGVNPVLIYLSKSAAGWQAVDDRSKQVSNVIGTGSASSFSNSRLLENPYGNRHEKTATASSTGVSRVNSQSKTTLYEGRQVTRLTADLSLPPDIYGLRLGDLFTANVNGTSYDAWLNVIQYTWDTRGERIKGRIDAETQKWT